MKGTTFPSDPSSSKMILWQISVVNKMSNCCETFLAAILNNHAECGEHFWPGAHWTEDNFAMITLDMLRTMYDNPTIKLDVEAAELLRLCIGANRLDLVKYACLLQIPPDDYLVKTKIYSAEMIDVLIDFCNTTRLPISKYLQPNRQFYVRNADFFDHILKRNYFEFDLDERKLSYASCYLLTEIKADLWKYGNIRKFLQSRATRWVAYDHYGKVIHTEENKELINHLRQYEEEKKMVENFLVDVCRISQDVVRRGIFLWI